MAVAISPFLEPVVATEAVRRRLPVVCRPVQDAAERALHLEIRRRVFVEEQGLFDASDLDTHDDDPATVHVLALCGTVAGGTVRLYPLASEDDPGLWKGDRLAVLQEFRTHGLGAPLVRFAVRTAGEAGGRRMIAHIQPPNISFFEHLGWHQVGEAVTFVGRPHQMMAIDL
jgi:putative N-acetyltransferase (TIGR04045 family)